MANKEQNQELDLRPRCESLITDFSVKSLLLGLNFPETANQFQKSMLYLAHLMAILRESVLKGRDIEKSIISDIVVLATIAEQNSDEQR